MTSADLAWSDMISEDGVKLISGLLADAGVPSVLWGDFLLNVYGVPSIIGGMEFVVPDEKIEVAVATLKSSRLRRCPDPEACVVSGDSSPFPVPVFHMHIEGSEVDVTLRAHSSTLWFIPEPASTSSKMIQKAYYLDASSPEIPAGTPGRASGAFSSAGPGVVVPRAHILLEAYIRLASAFRDDYVHYFLSMVTYMSEYTHPEGLIDLSLLSSPCRSFWDGRDEGKIPMIQLLDDLQQGLGDGAAAAESESDHSNGSLERS
ncbi:hypothetical protein F4778DRAFT_452334 [Xylariomycetidae sp. FL2044]|nr:hypothetical protein F4778DRAFT_452334 [Xylariomycetidae sp. FL2044]